MEPWVPGAIAGVAAILIALIGGWLQNRRESRARVHTDKSPEPPTTQQVWSRLDHQEKVLRAAVGVLGEVADQWDGEHPPVLSRRHVAVLTEEGYMPPEWDPVITST